MNDEVIVHNETGHDVTISGKVVENGKHLKVKREVAEEAKRVFGFIRIEEIEKPAAVDESATAETKPKK